MDGSPNVKGTVIKEKGLLPSKKFVQNRTLKPQPPFSEMIKKQSKIKQCFTIKLYDRFALFHSDI